MLGPDNVRGQEVRQPAGRPLPRRCPGARAGVPSSRRQCRRSSPQARTRVSAVAPVWRSTCWADDLSLDVLGSKSPTASCPPLARSPAAAWRSSASSHSVPSSGKVLHAGLVPLGARDDVGIPVDRVGRDRRSGGRARSCAGDLHRFLQRWWRTGCAPDDEYILLRRATSARSAASSVLRVARRVERVARSRFYRGRHSRRRARWFPLALALDDLAQQVIGPVTVRDSRRPPPARRAALAPSLRAGRPGSTATVSAGVRAQHVSCRLQRARQGGVVAADLIEDRLPCDQVASHGVPRLERPRRIAHQRAIAACSASVCRAATRGSDPLS